MAQVQASDRCKGSCLFDLQSAARSNTDGSNIAAWSTLLFRVSDAGHQLPTPNRLAATPGSCACRSDGCSTPLSPVHRNYPTHNIVISRNKRRLPPPQLSHCPVQTRPRRGDLIKHALDAFDVDPNPGFTSARESGQSRSASPRQAGRLQRPCRNGRNLDSSQRIVRVSLQYRSGQELNGECPCATTAFTPLRPVPPSSGRR
jgi:hypothetical protein